MTGVQTCALPILHDTDHDGKPNVYMETSDTGEIQTLYGDGVPKPTPEPTSEPTQEGVFPEAGGANGTAGGPTKLRES